MNLRNFFLLLFFTFIVGTALVAQPCNTCNPAFIINSGLVACYPFSGDANDASGNLHHGTASGLAFGPDRFGNASACGMFDGVASEVVVNPAAFQLSTYTYSAWVNIAANPLAASFYSILSIGTSAKDQQLMLSNDVGKLGLGYNSYNTTVLTPDSFWEGALPVLNTWHHIVLTRTATTLNFYVNGALIDTRSTTGPNPAYGAGTECVIGARVGTTHDQYFTGMMDDVRIYNRELTATEVSALYQFDQNGFAVEAGTNKMICKYDSVQLVATGAVSYTWTPSATLSNAAIANPYAKPTFTTQYYVTGTTGTCSAIDSVTVNVTILPVYAGSDIQICVGGSGQLQATGADTYIWTPAAGLSGTTIDNPTASPAVTTDYIVEGKQGGCVEYDTVNVAIDPGPIVELGADTFKCIRNDFTFTPTVTNADAYLWSPAGELDNVNVIYPTTQTTVPQYFKLTATNTSTGCSNSDSVFLAVRNPKALFDVSDSVASGPPLLVTITNNSTPTPLNYSWRITDSVPEYDFTPSPPPHTYSHFGKYPITLIVTDDVGCVDSMTRNITINELMNIYIPNSFTPNDDGLNDIFQVRYNTSNTLLLKGSIWDRWGSKIYDFMLPTGTWWDGKIGGIDAPSDVYCYQITIIDTKNNTVNYKGTINLLR